MQARLQKTPNTASEMLADFHTDIFAVQQYIAVSIIVIGITGKIKLSLK